MRGMIVVALALMLSGCGTLGGGNSQIVQGFQERCVTDFVIALGPLISGSMTGHCEPKVKEPEPKPVEPPAETPIFPPR